MRSKIGHLLHKSGHFDSDMHTTVALRRIFQEMIILRRIFNYSEEDKSGNDSFEEDKSEKDISEDGNYGI